MSFGDLVCFIIFLFVLVSQGRHVTLHEVSEFVTFFLLLTLTKLIKNWSIERAEGKAWIFFIFAICDWLPLNYRIHSHSNDIPKTLCCLCQGNTPETTEHLFTCPALRRT